MTSLRTAVLFGLITAIAAPAVTAQNVQVNSVEVVGPRELTPPTLAQPELTLSEAVALTIRRSPSITRSSLTLLAAEGRLQQSRGMFDPSLLSRPSVTFTLSELTPGLRALEFQKRVTVREIAKAFGTVHTALRDLIDGTNTQPPRCPTGLGLTATLDTSNVGREPAEIGALGVDPDLLSNVIIDLGGLNIDITDICSTRVDPLLSPEAFANVWQRIETIPPGGLGLNEVLESVLQIPFESRLLQAEIAEAVSVRAQLAYERLAEIPTDDLIKHLALDVGLSKLLRNGMWVNLSFQIQNQEHTFIDKPLDPSFGGFSVPPQFYSSFSGSLTLPLGKGRGSRAVAAPERAAEKLVDGQREQVRHAVSQEVFRTVLAYLNLIAAQESAELLAESESRQQELLDLTEQMVTLQTLAEADRTRVMAKAASVASTVSQARSRVYDARVSLAETMGLTAESLSQAPIATDRYAGISTTTMEVQALIDEALAERRDRRALDHSRDAASITAAGARDDMRHRFDVSLTAGLANFYESPFYKFLPDETAPVIDARAGLPIASLTGSPVPPPDAVRFGSPAGIGRAISGRYEPFVIASITVDVPFGNNAAKGRAAQADANYRASAINAGDLVRVIGENILGVTEALERTGRAVTRWEEAVENSRQMHQAELDRLRIGQATLIDTVLTEESLTADELQLVRARQAFLSTLARLRFETGGLVSFDDQGSPDEAIRFSSGDFVAR